MRGRATVGRVSDAVSYVSGVPSVASQRPIVEASPAATDAEVLFAATLTAAAAGDQLAWTALYQSVASKLRAYAVAQGATEPDDLVGDVFVQIARNLGRFTGTSANFRSWVFMIAHSRIIDARRAARRRPRPVELDEAAAELRSVRDIDAESAALDRFAVERLNAHLADLTEDQRQVLLLRYLGDLTLQEVASVTGRPLGAVKQLHRRGLRSIRKNLDAGVPS